jgi:DMSO reductase family type II enzyme heme b subunit
VIVADELVPIEVCRVQAPLDALLAPGAEEWGRAEEAVVPLEATPIDRQPSAYVQVAWQDQPRGQVSEVRVRAATGGGVLAMRLEWATLRPSRRISDVNVYPDACAVVFPADGREAEFATMGSSKQPVGAWHWRAGTDAPFAVTATGIGTVERAAEHPIQAGASWSDGRWQVVLAGPQGADGIPYGDGSAVPVAFAVWSGAARERAGLKSFSPQPCELRLGQGGGRKP